MIDTGVETEREKQPGEVEAGHDAAAGSHAASGHGTRFVTSAPHLPPAAAAAGAAATPTASERAYGHADPMPVVKTAALGAVHRVISERESSPAAGGVAEQGGHALGVALGVIVTEALAALPSWNAPVVDNHGAQVEQVPGAERIGNHPIRKRHEEVVGPKVTAAVERMSPGVLHDLLQGVGLGATEAPGDSYRLEAHIADLIRAHLGK